MLFARNFKTVPSKLVCGLVMLVALGFAGMGNLYAANCDEPGVAAYSAVQDGGEIYVFACGVHRTGGFENCLTIGPEDIFPPFFDFKIKRPTGPTIQMITPFVARAQFSAQQAIRQVQVRDARGTHKVPVVSLASVKKTMTTTASSSKRRVLASTYQDKPIDFGVGKFRQVSVLGQIADGATVDVMLDPNTCGLNEFGDTTICTKMAPTNVKARVVRVRLPDPSGAGRSIYRLESNQWPKSQIVYLTTHPTADCARLVVQHAGEGGSPRRVVIALEECRIATQKAIPERGGLCKVVGQSEVGEPRLIEMFSHKVDLNRESVIVVRNNKSSLCPSHAAIAILLVNEKIAAYGDITDEKNLIQANANLGDRVTALVQAVPLDNGTVCVRLGQVEFTLEQCDLE